MKQSLIFLCLFFAGCCVAQNDAYMSNNLFINSITNPAATGFSDAYEIASVARSQWASWEGNPQTLAFAVTKNLKNEKSGLGANVVLDQLGYQNTHQCVNAKISYAQHLKLSQKVRLSIGIAAGIMQTVFDASKHILEDPDDEVIGNGRQVKTKPDVNIGIELNTSSKFKFGVTMVHFGKYRGWDNTFWPHEHLRTYFEQTFKLNPAFNLISDISYIRGNSLNMFEITNKLFWKETLWIGLAYRPVNAISTIIGIKFDKFSLGYAYDMPSGKHAPIQANSNEVMLLISI